MLNIFIYGNTYKEDNNMCYIAHQYTEIQYKVH